jgi:Spx/MgsR family transcriptional regulator
VAPAGNGGTVKAVPVPLHRIAHGQPAGELPKVSITLYGLDKCDTCTKARNWLRRAGIEYAFVDYRAQPVPPATLRAWAGKLGGFDKLVNRASMTWRNLSPARKAPGSDPEWTLLIKEYPALVKRPVVVGEDGTVGVGFNDRQFKARFGG